MSPFSFPFTQKEIYINNSVFIDQNNLAVSKTVWKKQWVPKRVMNYRRQSCRDQSTELRPVKHLRPKIFWGRLKSDDTIPCNSSHAIS